MTLTILTDDEIRSLLENLTPGDLGGFSEALASALHEYSAARQDGRWSDTSIHQPERIAVHSAATGATTLFMPSCNSAGNAVKVITLTSAAAADSTPTKTGDEPQQHQTKKVIPPTGAITLFGPAGSPLGLLHAATLTAFRTALASLAMVVRRKFASSTLVVFGRGGQAYWHVRLALLARGPEVRRVVFVGRRRRRTVVEAGEEGSGSGLLARFTEGVPLEMREREGWADCEFEELTGEDEEYTLRLAGVLREADVVFCCTPSSAQLFDASALLWGGSDKGWLIVAIGSYTPEMREVPGDLIMRAITRGGGEREAGVVVVDTIEGALKEAGELIEVGVKPEQLVELGELLEPKGAGDKATDKKRENLSGWLETGNVIYKSVGTGLMDLSIGMHLIEFAKQKGIGTHVQGF
ncbi:hypothetical protein C7999DRAFT_12639 [Corynascus novoguineensis]|uniref:Ornithine cyclodeaminase n=1 Tax=Corynascus novoguineensis TaxID=1126955 RepID=A0AAN7CZ19_9PEZI|nr:hypothetical protein C7999DRAFT_12639 [Corynascus novoguineensis]